MTTVEPQEARRLWRWFAARFTVLNRRKQLVTIDPRRFYGSPVSRDEGGRCVFTGWLCSSEVSAQRDAREQYPDLLATGWQIDVVPQGEMHALVFTSPPDWQAPRKAKQAA